MINNKTSYNKIHKIKKKTPSFFNKKKKKDFFLHKKSLYKKKTRLVTHKKHYIKKEKNNRKFFFLLLLKKKITFFKKLNLYYNERRLIWHKIIKIFLPNSKKKWIKYKKKIGHIKFFYFILKLERRLSTLLLRARFFYKIINSYRAIKYRLVLGNNIIIIRTDFLVNKLDLIQKKRTKIPAKKNNKLTIKKSNKSHKNINSLKKNNKLCYKKKRYERMKWRKNRWKKARFLFWKIRRASHFNMYFAKKETTIFNYLEINYKIPAFFLTRMPLKNEIVLNKQRSLIHSILLSKIYFIY